MRNGFVRMHEWIAECMLAESSAFSATSFYVEAFVLPRFVPSDHLYFDYGFRVGDRWEALSEELLDKVRAARPQLEGMASLGVLWDRASRPDVNLHHTELRLCISILQESTARFTEAADAIARWQSEREWENGVLGRCRDVISKVNDTGFAEGIASLENRRPPVDQLLR
jgi:hypothetical protein